MSAYRIIALVLMLFSGAVYVSAQTFPDSTFSVKSDSTVSAMPAGKRGLISGLDDSTKHITRGVATLATDSGLVLKGDTIRKSDSTSVLKVKKHSPLRAVWMSAVLPGLGQAYNKKYWKIPIVYAGLGSLGYLVYYEAHQYSIARDAYRTAVRANSRTAEYLGTELDQSTIKAYRDFYLKYLNYAAVGLVVWYGLNLIDAAVDGHLYHYNMDDKLSFNVDPSFHIASGFGPDPTCLGLSITVIPLAVRHKRVM